MPYDATKNSPPSLPFFLPYPRQSYATLRGCCCRRRRALLLLWCPHSRTMTFVCTCTYDADASPPAPRDALACLHPKQFECHACSVDLNLSGDAGYASTLTPQIDGKNFVPHRYTYLPTLLYIIDVVNINPSQCRSPFSSSCALSQPPEPFINAMSRTR